MDVSVLARAKSLDIGCRVTAVRQVRGVKKGAQGTLKGLGKEALVMWDEGALVDGEEGQQERMIPIASVQVATPEEKPAQKPVEKPAEVPLPACMRWAKLTPAMAAQGLEQLVVGALYQLLAHRSATSDQVVIESEGAGRIFANTKIKPRGLIVLPHVPELGEAVGTDKARDVVFTTDPEIYIKLGNLEYRYTLGAPAHKEAVDAESGGDAEAGESPPVVDLFWRIHNSAQAKVGASPRGELIRATAEVTVPAACATIKDTDLRGTAGKPRGAITIWVPYLTNKVELCSGDELWVKKQTVE